jgi:Ion transport protein
MLTFFCTLTFLILIPIDLAFNNHLLSGDLYIFTVLASTILLLNMLAEMNTGYLDYGHFIKDRLKIMQRHLRDGVLFDLVAIVTVLVIQVQQKREIGLPSEKDREYTSTFMLIFFSQFRRILIQKRSFDEQMNWSIFHRTVYSICIILFTVVYIQHCFSCIWAYIGLSQLEGHQSGWIEKQNLALSGWPELYLNSLYYTIVTFSSVGYGDLTPICIKII